MWLSFTFCRIQDITLKINSSLFGKNVVIVIWLERIVVNIVVSVNIVVPFVWVEIVWFVVVPGIVVTYFVECK